MSEERRWRFEWYGDSQRVSRLLSRPFSHLLNIDDGWLFFYRGLLLLVVHAKHTRAEMLNSSTLGVEDGL